MLQGKGASSSSENVMKSGAGPQLCAWRNEKKVNQSGSIGFELVSKEMNIMKAWSR